MQIPSPSILKENIEAGGQKYLSPAKLKTKFGEIESEPKQHWLPENMLLGFDFWRGACFVVEFCNLFRISTRTWLSGLVRGSFLWFLRSKSSGCIVIKVMAWGEKTTTNSNHEPLLPLSPAPSTPTTKSMYTAKKRHPSKTNHTLWELFAKNCLDHPWLRKELWHIQQKKTRAGQHPRKSMIIKINCQSL